MKTFSFSLGVIAVLLLSYSPVCAQEVVEFGCKGKRAGYLRIVDSPDQCRKHETAVTFGQPAAAQQESVTAVKQLKVYDVSGQFIGILINSEVWAEVNIYSPDTETFFYLNPDWQNINQYYTYEEALYYESQDCTGTPYRSNYYPYFNYAFRNSGAYYKATDVVENISAQSSVYGSAECNTYDHPQEIEANRAIVMENLPFTLPIEGPLQFRYE